MITINEAKKAAIDARNAPTKSAVEQVAEVLKSSTTPEAEAIRKLAELLPQPQTLPQPEE
jgi:hypothetical protein